MTTGNPAAAENERAAVSTGPEARLERQNLELTILNSIADVLNESVDLPASLAAVLSCVADALELRTGWVWLLDEVTGEPYLAAAQNLPRGLAGRPERMEGPCYCLDTFRAGDLSGAANVNVVTCSRLRWLDEAAEGLRYHASIPLYARGKRLGVMNVASREWRRLADDDLRLLHTIGDMLGIAIERARLFSRSVEMGATEERNRLAREIHDTIAQGLSATALQLETADALLDANADPAGIRRAIRCALDTTRRNLEDVRRSVLDLRAAPLQGRPLAEALRDLCARRDSAPDGAASATFHAVGSARPLPSRVEAGLFRVAQEALANVDRHADASRVTVRFTAGPDRVVLGIVDDGAGFDVEGAGRDRYGLIGMRERVRLLGGELRIDSRPGGGTRIEAVVPLE